MDQIIDDIGSRISAWLWFARSTSLGSEEIVSDLMGEVGTPARRLPGEGAEAGEIR